MYPNDEFNNQQQNPQNQQYYVQIDPVQQTPQYTQYTQPQTDPNPTNQSPSGNRKGVKLVAAALAMVLVAGAAGGVAGYTAGRSGSAANTTTTTATTMSTNNTNTTATPTNGDSNSSTTATTLVSDGLELSPAGDELLTPAQVYEQNVNAVVAISTEGVTTNSWGQQARFASSGSGFIITADGYVVTNHHVIDEASTITVILTSGESYEAQLVGSDEDNDVALLKIDATNLPTVSLGDSDNLSVGDQVAAIGNPLGELTNTLTVGYLSAKEREISTTEGTASNMLQTDAAINSGNSGGPLFDMYGNVIGITTAKYASSSIEGLGFAIPINDAMEIVYDLVEYGYVTSRPLMGVSVRDLDSVTASYYSLPVGVYVGEVSVGGAAEEAGVQQGDIITAIDDTEVTCYNDLNAALRDYRAGDTATLTLYRGGQTVTVEITFDEKLPETTEATESETGMTDPNSQDLPQDNQQNNGWYGWYSNPYASDGGNNY